MKVGTRTLDSVIDELEIKKVNFIKVDVEGAELKVLAGAQNVLKSNRDLGIVVASYHYPEEAQEVSEFLASRNFKISRKSYVETLSPYIYAKCEHFVD